MNEAADKVFNFADNVMQSFSYNPVGRFAELWPFISRYILYVSIIIDCFLIVMLIVIRHRHRKNKHIYEISARDQQLAELDARISNPEYLARNNVAAMKRFPYDTRYLSDAESTRNFNGIFADLLVETEYVKQRYYTDTAFPIDVGKDAACSITIQDDRLAGHQLMIYTIDNDLYCRNLSEDHAVILTRKDEGVKLTATPIALEEGDVIRAGKSGITVESINRTQFT